MMEGWIKLHRKLLEWEWYDDANVFRLFVHCVLKANHAEKNWRGIIIKTGEFVTSTDKLSSELRLSSMQIRTALKKLKATNEITIKTTSQYTVIQVNKYLEYQVDNKQSNKRITNKPIVTGKQVH